jgi:hypothetical protein
VGRRPELVRHVAIGSIKRIDALTDITLDFVPESGGSLSYPGRPAPAKSSAQMTRICDGSALPRADKSNVYLLRAAGQEAQEV